MGQSKIKDKHRQSVMSINKTLKEKGYSWEQIETFWDECISEAKNNINTIKYEHTKN